MLDPGPEHRFRTHTPMIELLGKLGSTAVRTTTTPVRAKWTRSYCFRLRADRGFGLGDCGPRGRGGIVAHHRRRSEPRAYRHRRRRMPTATKARSTACPEVTKTPPRGRSVPRGGFRPSGPRACDLAGPCLGLTRSGRKVVAPDLHGSFGYRLNGSRCHSDSSTTEVRGSYCVAT